MKLLTFVEIDLRKIMPFLIGLFLVALLAFQGIFYNAVSSMNDDLVTGAAENAVPMEEYLQSLDKMSLTSILDVNTFPLVLLGFIGLVLILFGFLLWYKEWFGASKRIYTLLSIKGSRFRIFISKLIVFLLVFISYYGIILLNLYLATVVMGAVLPETILADNLFQSFIIHSQLLPFILPVSGASLFFNVVFIMMMFAILSVLVLMDRSKKIWGMIVGFLYMSSTIALFIYLTGLELFTDERTLVNWIFTVVVLALSTGISYYLLKKKVSI